MTSTKRILVAASLLAGPCGLASAHHSGAAYDNGHLQSMAGTVKAVNWTNPHITFVVDKDAKAGEAADTWVFEVSSPGVLTRSGWTKRSLQAGDHAVFQFAPLRSGGRGGYLQKVTLPDGRELGFSLTPS